MDISISDLEVIVLDFDGVLTDNAVYINEDGKEMVKCNRSDGLAIRYLKKTSLKIFILSTEKNPVVTRRAEKLKIPVIQGSANKKASLLEFCKANNFDLSRTMYVGNDLNDYYAMKTCGYRACPSDSHPEIIKISNYPLETKGGGGVVRELLEKLVKADMLSLLNY